MKSVKNIHSFKGLPFEAHIINHRHHIWEWHNLDKDKNDKMNTHIPCFCIYLHLIFYFICFFIVHLSTQLNIHLHMLCAYTCMCTLTLLFKPFKSIFHIPLSFTPECVFPKNNYIILHTNSMKLHLFLQFKFHLTISI